MTVGQECGVFAKHPYGVQVTEHSIVWLCSFPRRVTHSCALSITEHLFASDLWGPPNNVTALLFISLFSVKV